MFDLSTRRAARIATPAVLLVSLLTGCAGSGNSATYAAAVTKLLYDPASGRDLAHWPKSPLFDHRHMKLEIVIADMNATHAACRATLELASLGRARNQVRFDATGLHVSSVVLDSTVLKYSLEDDQLLVDLPRAYNPGEVFSLRVDYSVNYPDGQGNGLTWAAGDPKATSPTDQSPMLHAQGQSEWNHTWFPCVDFPNHKLTTELLITIPDGYTSISNGYLASTTPDAQLDPRPANAPSQPRAYTRWHWVQDKPHPTYLVSLIIGKFSTVNLNAPGQPADLSAHDGKQPPLVVFAPVGKEERGYEIFQRTPAMVEFLGKLFDEPYPWSKYAQTSARGFRWGGMENTSATTLEPSLWTKDDPNQDELIVHELAHQWMGDLVTCRSWEHAWLNEGWASLAEPLWAAELARTRKGGSADDAYLNYIINWVNDLAKKDPDGVSPPMVSRYYDSPDDPFEKPDDIYAKGGVVLHMLRERVGDAAFWAGTRRYIDDHKFGSAETSDLRRALEASSGESLEQFFWQWTARQGLPRADIAITQDPRAFSLAVSLKQTQRISADRPAYQFDLPLRVTLADGSVKQLTLPVTERTAALTARFPGPVVSCEVDPRFTVGGVWNTSKSESMWKSELTATSLWSRVQAASALRAIGTPSAKSALAVLDLEDAPSSLQTAVGD